RSSKATSARHILVSMNASPGDELPVGPHREYAHYFSARAAVRSGFEIARPVEIGNQPGLFRLPSQQFASSLTRSRVIERREMREPVEVVGCFLGGLADDRYVQSAADHASDVSERHAPFGDPMVAGSCGTLLERQPEEMRSIKPVHGGPAVEP